ncbi:MAG: hypothetical protein J7L96_03960 [Bacteroidales bacterium]|nr:hypothetical protein [Bacteroidales bacterium]
MKKLLFILCLWGSWSTLSHAQYLKSDFARHLTEKRYFQEVIDLTNRMPLKLNTTMADSLNFYRAWAMYNLKKVPEGIKNFRKVSSDSKLFNQSMFFCGWSSAYLKKYSEANHDLDFIKQTNNIEKELLRIQYSGIELLSSQTDSALSHLNQLANQHTIYSDQVETLKKYALETIDFKPKSMALAGLFSAVIPGSGKIYANEKGAGIASFLLLAGMGGMAAENIIKTGFTSWNSILFTSLFSVFYLGNVYGSIISIKTYRERFYEETEQAIVATMLIPLRDYFR